VQPALTVAYCSICGVLTQIRWTNRLQMFLFTKMFTWVQEVRLISCKHYVLAKYCQCAVDAPCSVRCFRWSWLWNLQRRVLKFYYLRQQDESYMIVLLFCHSFCHSVNRITDKCGNGRRPDLAGTGKGWPSRSDILVLIWICMWIPDHFFIFFTIAKNGIFGHLLAFIIQSMADLYHTWRNDWCWQDNASTTFWDRSYVHSDPD